MEHNKEIDSLFREILNDFEEQPSKMTWNKLGSMLDNEEAMKYRRKYRSAMEMVAFLVFLLFITCATTYFAIQKTRQSSVKQKMDNVISKVENTITRHAINNNNNEPLYSSVPNRIQSAKVNRNSSSPLFHNSALLLSKLQKNSVSSNENKVFGNIEKPGLTFNTEQISGLEPNISLRDKSIELQKKLIPIDINSIEPAQITRQKNTIKPFYSLAFSYTAKHTYNNIIDNSPFNGINEKKEIDDIERNKTCYNIGIAGAYHFNNKWSIESGIYFSNTKIAISREVIYPFIRQNGNVAYKFNSSSGSTCLSFKNGTATNPVNDSIYINRGTEELNYLKIPLLASFSINSKKWSISPSLGFSYNYLTGMKVKTEIQHGATNEIISINNLRGSRKTYAGFVSSLNVGYNINRYWAVNVTPSYCFSITPVTENKLIKTYTQSLGIGVGLGLRID